MNTVEFTDKRKQKVFEKWGWIFRVLVVNTLKPALYFNQECRDRCHILYSTYAKNAYTFPGHWRHSLHFKPCLILPGYYECSSNFQYRSIYSITASPVENIYFGTRQDTLYLSRLIYENKYAYVELFLRNLYNDMVYCIKSGKCYGDGEYMFNVRVTNDLYKMYTESELTPRIRWV